MKNLFIKNNIENKVYPAKLEQCGACPAKLEQCGACPAKRQRSGGFTLIETLVAISIFTVSILSVMAVLSSGISNTNYAKKKMIASYLAQEGIEEIRNMRDTYVLYLSSGTAGFGLFANNALNGVLVKCLPPNGCYFDNANLLFGDPGMPITNIPLVSCDNPTCSTAPLKYGSGQYGYGSSQDDSGFTRKITATAVSNNEIKITSTVFWTQGSGNPSISFSENLFNWVE